MLAAAAAHVAALELPHASGPAIEIGCGSCYSIHHHLGGPSAGTFADGFESGGSGAWTSTDQ